MKICKAYNVTHISLEDSFNGTNPKVGKRLARLYGSVTCLLYENGFTLLYCYTPASWRKTVCGNGKKSKLGVYNYVCENIVDIGMPFAEKGKDKCDDMVEAIAIAFCLYKKLNK